MDDKKIKISFKSILSFIVILLIIILPIVLTLIDYNINRELVVLFWLFLSLNFIFIIVTTISRLSNDFVTMRYYNYLFYRMYGEKLNLKDSGDFINSILSFYKRKGDDIDFKEEKIRLKEIEDSSYEISGFPLLTVFFTVLYAISIYDSSAETNIISLNNELILIILDIILLFTFIYIFTLTYVKSKTSLVKLCLNIIEEYELDKGNSLK